ncbi:hypothetical protein LUZ61_001140 [Rhynchospora tenuis]|uniref:SWIM-type domain-containing protein n=1 Tax=Rhynchospora tenuis TaxID=198213 RepID=A0AAD6EQQ1_9POAL|nr:hypothetical protein LUZ61_001140 [Rhynchospora tenuis]
MNVLVQEPTSFAKMRYRNHFSEKPNYGSSECFFTCEVHHGGTVHMENTKFSYTGCKKDYFDYIDPDEISLLEFETMAEQLGYSKEISIWCRPCGGKDTNPKIMMSDQELLSMIDNIMKLNRVLECFVHHKKGCVEVEKEVQVEAVGVEAEKEVQVENVVVEAEKEVQVENVVVEAQNEVQVEVEGVDKNGEKDVVDADMDFYDPDNDVEADDIDVNCERNVIDENCRRDWIMPYKNQLEPFPTEEDSDYAPSDVLISGGETDGEDTSRRYPEFNALVDMKNPQFQVDWLVNHYLDTFRADPNWSAQGIQARIITDLHLEISRQKAWDVKRKALKIIVGKEGEQYSKLHSYADEIKRKNPGTTIIYELRNKVFKRAYMCLAACKEGFLAGCRPIISLDGCFLKTRYGGQLLSAVGIDANDCIFPIAYAVVETENSASWKWFLQLLGNDLEVRNSHSWTFMSDRQKGLVPMLKSLFPNSEFRFCVRHLYDNYNLAGHKGKALKDRLWACAMASYAAQFENKMKELEIFNKAAYEWDKPIITMLEMIKTRLMQRFQVKRDEMLKCTGSICPKIQKKLDRWKEESIKFRAIWNGATQYQVTGFEGQFVVNIAKSSCDCRKWDLTGIPCEHACASMRVNGLAPEDFVDNCYKVETFLKIYSESINPISGDNMWKKSTLSEPKNLLPGFNFVHDVFSSAISSQWQHGKLLKFEAFMVAIEVQNL